MKTSKKVRAIAFDIIQAHGQTGTVAQLRRPVSEKTDTLGEIQMSLIVWGIKSGGSLDKVTNNYLVKMRLTGEEPAVTK